MAAGGEVTLLPTHLGKWLVNEGGGTSNVVVGEAGAARGGAGDLIFALAESKCALAMKWVAYAWPPPPPPPPPSATAVEQTTIHTPTSIYANLINLWRGGTLEYVVYRAGHTNTRLTRSARIFA